MDITSQRSSSLFWCETCETTIKVSGICQCDEIINSINEHAHYYREQIKKIIIFCIEAGVPCPSQFPPDMSYEVCIEGNKKTIYNVYSG